MECKSRNGFFIAGGAAVLMLWCVLLSLIWLVLFRMNYKYLRTQYGAWGSMLHKGWTRAIRINIFQGLDFDITWYSVLICLMDLSLISHFGLIDCYWMDLVSAILVGAILFRLIKYRQVLDIIFNAVFSLVWAKLFFYFCTIIVFWSDERFVLNEGLRI